MFDWFYGPAPAGGGPRPVLWNRVVGSCGCLALLLVGCVILTLGAAYVFWPRGAAPAVVNINPPVVQPPVVQQPLATSPVSSLTTEEVKRLTGVDVQRLGTESAAWVWRGVSPATTSAKCPSGFVCTFDVVGDIVVVHAGVGQSAQIRAGTWRQIAAYPTGDAVHNICALYQKEKAFGLSEVPSFQVRFAAARDGSGTPVGPQSCP